MNASPLWLDFRPRPDLPLWTRRVTGEVTSPQGKAALRELRQGFAALSAEAAGDGPCLRLREEPGEGEGWRLSAEKDGPVLSGPGRGLVYGAFALLRKLALGEAPVPGEEAPRYPLRMLDHWDNADGSIERGYAGNSFFFREGRPVCGGRTREYARLLASVGLNGCCLNNVNVTGEALYLLTGKYDGELRAIGEALAEYGVSLWLSVSFAAPLEQGGLPTADPLDPAVRRWWRETCDRLFRAVPDLGGFLVKADSEGRPGPQSYGRTQAEGANMLAEAVKPHGGRILWRCFVYDCTQDWRDLKTDRARAQYDTFAPLDGQFADNVLLQAKNGPVDFQVREPVSPLLVRLEHTKSIVEFQLAQEYTGQQKHVCWLGAAMKEVLDFTGPAGTVKDRLSAVCAVSNTGDDFNWTGHDLAAANLYTFGRLCWDPDLDAEVTAREWTRLTYGPDPLVEATVTDILLRSREVYEQYTVPLGIGWMCDPPTHYGPSPEGFEYDRWGTYHRATCREIGVERGPAGTGYSEQYGPALGAVYGNMDTCPEELLLFFHRLPYDYRMRDGRTLLQRIYDDHFEGCAAAEAMAKAWDALEGRVRSDAFRRVQVRFREQVRSAREWRDVVNSWLYRLTLIPDEKGRKLYL